MSIPAESAAQQPAQTKAQLEKAVGKQTTQPEVPAPDVVNSEVPKKRLPDPLDGPPFVTAKAWAIADGRTGAVLWGHDEARRVDIASTTKIMTAFVVLRLAAEEPPVLDEMVTFSRRADGTIGSTSGVEEGEQLPVRELLYGLLLPSGNDAAVAFAEHFGGRMKPAADASIRRRSIAAIHRRDEPRSRRARPARDALCQSQWTARTGSPIERPRSRQARASLPLKLPTFARYVSTMKHGSAVRGPNGSKRNVVWTNTNRLLDTEGYDGVKTGPPAPPASVWSPAAGATAIT